MHTTELSSVAGEMDWRAAKEEAQKRGSRCDLERLNPRNGARSQVSPLPGRQYLSIPIIQLFFFKKPHHSSPIVIVHPIFIR